MALIKCPECEAEISDTSDVCVNCGFPIKNKKNTNIKRIIPMMACVIIAAIILIFVVNFINKTNYPEMMQVLRCSYVADAKELLGDDYEIRSSTTVLFYVYNNLALDGIVYDTAHITENADGGLYEIGFEFSVDDLEIIESYIKDISQIYGDYTQRDNSYIWKTANSLNPDIYIHGKESPYTVRITLN